MADVFNKNPSSFVDMNELFPVLNERTGLTSEQFKKVVENLIYVYNNLASGGSGGSSGGGVVFTPSVDVNGNLSWTNNGGLENPTTVNIRGADGATGAAAGFGTPTASVDGNTGTPSVTVTASGEDTAKVFNFEFKNLKGEKGDTGAQGVGTPGVTPNISVAATSLSSSASATATRSGTDEEPLITFGIPRGKSFQDIGTFSIDPSEWSALSDATPYTVQATTTVTLQAAVEENCPIMISFDDVISSAGVVLASATGTTTLTLVFYAISTPSNGITGTLGGVK